MLFALPKRRIGEPIWYLNQQDMLVHGTVDMYTLCVKKDEVTVWYGVVTDAGKTDTVSESQILENDHYIPSPKYHIGDEVHYQYENTEGQSIYDTGTVSKIEIILKDPRHAPNVYYIMEEDENYFVHEDEVLSFAEKDVNGITVGGEE